MQLPESLEQSLPGSSSARPSSPTKGFRATNLAMGATEKDKPKEKEKSKEVREREKVEKRLTDVRRALFCLDGSLLEPFNVDIVGLLSQHIYVTMSTANQYPFNYKCALNLHVSPSQLILRSSSCCIATKNLEAFLTRGSCYILSFPGSPGNVQ